jgi:hypothetical protein
LYLSRKQKKLINKLKIFALVAFLFAIGVAYATINDSLFIKGKAKIDAQVVSTNLRVEIIETTYYPSQNNNNKFTHIYTLNVYNEGNQLVNDWRMRFKIEDENITSNDVAGQWGCDLHIEDGFVVVTPSDYNRQIYPNNHANCGMIIENISKAKFDFPKRCYINDEYVEVDFTRNFTMIYTTETEDVNLTVGETYEFPYEFLLVDGDSANNYRVIVYAYGEHGEWIDGNIIDRDDNTNVIRATSEGTAYVYAVINGTNQQTERVKVIVSAASGNNNNNNNDDPNGNTNNNGPVTKYGATARSTGSVKADIEYVPAGYDQWGNPKSASINLVVTALENTGDWTADFEWPNNAAGYNITDWGALNDGTYFSYSSTWPQDRMQFSLTGKASNPLTAGQKIVFTNVSIPNGVTE